MQRSLRGRILILCLPLLALALLVFFFFSWRVLESSVNHIVARNAQFQSHAISQTLTQILAEARNHLLLLASGELDQATMARRLKYRGRLEKAQYREVAFIGLTAESKYLFLNCGGEIIVVPPEVALNTVYGPFHNIGANQFPGRVNVAQPVEVSYTLLPVSDSLQSVTFQVLRFSTAVHDAEGHFQGVLILSLDLSALRTALSTFSSAGTDSEGNAPGSPIRSLFFDKDGWMLFQSEGDPADEQDKPLRTDAVRGGFRGDFGRPGFGQAFRPGPEYLNYWNMVLDVQNGRSGRFTMPESGYLWGDGQMRLDGVSYVPVNLPTENENSKSVIGGVAVLDSSFTLMHAGTQIIGIHACCFFIALALLGGGLWLLAGTANRQLHILAKELESRNQQESLDPLTMPPMPQELEKIKNAANVLLERLRGAVEHNLFRQAQTTANSLREPADNLPDPEDVPSHGLVGNSPSMRHLQMQMRKAAPSAADVLIAGETGTGKELVSEYIHRLSPRAHGPFITINCGALDEGLLMDTLFGHVKGAFTEAKAARKGAFLAADGGTLMLDEVGNAAPKVQQALLRALSTRRIRPLGADYDVSFNTRIIAATNAKIGDEAMVGRFREDLYYRLAIITIHTPPLNQRKEDIPMLLVHFLSEIVHNGGPGMPKSMPKVSRGALVKLMEYNWPGNVRELKNCVTNALTFCEGGILLAEDIRIGSELSVPLKHPQSIPQTGKPAEQRPEREFPESTAAGGPDEISSLNAVPEGKLNPRQRRLLPHIVAQGGVSRHEYQALSGENISARTALYDLQAFVSVGILSKEGRGPALRYVPARKEAQIQIRPPRSVAA
ncbi:MAG: sigma 54-interacting transcriptional regulator [Desulfovibrio sp.]|nr:sigma 54-interacting transcriptional regulator [Desulfovibrio sp.]